MRLYCVNITKMNFIGIMTYCFVVLEHEIFPYGRTTNDSVFLGTDDGSTQRIVFDQPFLFYGRLLSSAFVRHLNLFCLYYIISGIK